MNLYVEEIKTPYVTDEERINEMDVGNLQLLGHWSGLWYRLPINKIDNREHLGRLGLEVEYVTLASDRFRELSKKMRKDKSLEKLDLGITSVILKGKKGKWVPLLASR